MSSRSSNDQQLCCLFYAHDPQTDGMSPSCANGFQKCETVMKHLKDIHYERFGDLTKQQYNQLKVVHQAGLNRKKTWEEWYRRVFPNEPVPSPFTSENKSPMLSSGQLTPSWPAFVETHYRTMEVYSTSPDQGHSGQSDSDTTQESS